jgi:APA family basic amino acid/polyamine antiporter
VATFTTLVPYAFCAMAELILAPRQREEADKRRLRATMLIGILAFAFSFVAIVGAGADTALKGFLALLLGVPVYVWLQRHPQPRIDNE